MLNKSSNKPWIKHYDSEVPEELKYPHIPAHQILRNTASFAPHAQAICKPGKGTATYLAVYDDAKRIANALIEQGVSKGDRVAVALPNSRQFVSFFWGILMSGGVAVPLNPLYTQTELNKIIAQTKPRVVIGVDIEGLNVPVKMAVNPAQDTPVFPEQPSVEPEIDIDPSRDLALIQYTGGTTGEPKGCMFTHENLVAAIYGQSVWSSPIASYIPHSERRMLCTLPFSHIFGLVTLGYATKTVTPITVLPRFSVESVVELVSREEFSYWPCVPTMLEMVLRHPAVTSGQIHLGERIRTISMGGAPVSPGLRSKIRQYSLNVYDGWAMTETCSRGIAPPLLGRKKPGSGLPCCGIDARIVSPITGADMPIGEEGELWVKGPSIMKGYWENDPETKRAFEDGWLKTGDVARMDEDGYITILGRYKETILHGGYTIYPQEIDNAILSYSSDFLDCITFGEDDDIYGENVVSVVRATQEHNQQKLLDYCRQHLAPFKVPSRVVFTNEPLPRTPAGKPLRQRTARWVREKGW